ncbi:MULTISPECIES: permease [unclassified Paenarthrobacter]|uniref:permease n=1 Tax=unclassified Paenarthrobacter TaxID=2634190 RepID=UPI001F21D3F0|nr:permease [Paenarthrobacter sp. AR 02]MCF3137828.1 permease [Paenarthrobacter sp. AR 02]
MKSWSIGVFGLVALAAIVASTFVSREAMVGVGIVASAAVGIGWPHFLAVPAKKTLAAVIGLSGVGSAVAAAYMPAPGFLDGTPAFVALGVMAVFVVQLVRGTGQAQRLESTLGCCAGVLLNCLGAGWIAGARFNGVKEMVLVAGLSAAVALLVGIIRWPDRIVAPLGVVMAALMGPLAGLVFSDIAVLPAALVGVVVGSVLVSFRRMTTLRRGRLNLAAAIGMGVAPVWAVGALAYFIDKLLIY